MVDLHTHSTFSDGTFAPAELIRLAAGKGITALALTDHDTLAGLDEAREAAKKEGIRLIRGVELSLQSSRGEFHLLGLGLAAECPDLEQSLREIREAREERNLKIIGKMQDAGIPAEYRDIQAIAADAARASGASGGAAAGTIVGTAPGGKFGTAGPGPLEKARRFFHKSPGEKDRPVTPIVVGRPHFARFLVDRGIAGSLGEAFEKYLKAGAPFYEPKRVLSLEEAVDLLNRAGALPVAAHPLSLRRSFSELEELFAQWRDRGVRGIEVVHPSANRNQSRRLEELAEKYGFLLSAGSDFHGENAPQRKLGKTSWGTKIPSRFSAILDYLN